MKNHQNAAGHPAGAGTAHASTLQITALIAAGQLAVDLCRAERCATELREIYVRKIREYEGCFGCIEGSLDPATAAHAAIIEFTADRRAAYLSSKSKAHNIKRRMRAACLKISRAAAVEGGAS